MTTPPSSSPDPSYGPADPWAPPSGGALPSYPGSSGTPESGMENRQDWAHEAASTGYPAAPGGRVRKSKGGTWRILLGVLLVLVTLSSVAGGSSVDTTEPVATLTVVVLRLLMLGVAVWLIVSGIRRKAEKGRLRRRV